MRTNTGIDFNNQLTPTKELNPYTYRNFYNGAGVGIGDFDNDGLQDLIFTGNQVDNKIYRNLGSLTFEDRTSDSGIAASGSWSTGVSVIDINGDGLQDVYICKAGPPNTPYRKNQLWINQGDFVFVDEASEYGLDFEGLSIHALFFDYDRDGDLDCYLLNNSLQSVGGFDIIPGAREQPSNSGNKLLRNDQGSFIDVSTDMGIYTSAIGFGLSAVATDVNDDGWVDLYVANDFFERDYYYENQEGRTFQERGEELFASMPAGSMGMDAADIDNDGNIDLYTVEMAPATMARRKTKATYESWDKHQRMIRQGYGHQYPRNALQVQRDNRFYEIGRQAGVEATEWSWASLLFDMDNDGDKDLFVSNGIGRDLLDRDYLTYVANEEITQSANASNIGETLRKLIELMPSQRVDNHFFLRSEEGQYETWESELAPTFSNASAYGDLDNDGDLDLVVSNVDDRAFILENHSELDFIQIELAPSESMRIVEGAKVTVWSDAGQQVQEMMPYRGFQSSVDRRLTFGLGRSSTNDVAVSVRWPNGDVNRYEDLAINQMHRLVPVAESAQVTMEKTQNRDDLRKVHFSIREGMLLDTKGTQAPLFNEFNKEPLLPSMLPATGRILRFLDIDGNGKRDLFIGGKRGVSDRVIMDYGGMDDMNDYVSLPASERGTTTDIAFLDYDNDGDTDVYVARGGRYYSRYSTDLDDVIYENVEGKLVPALDRIISFDERFMTGSVLPMDVNGDGFDDLIIGERMNSTTYGQTCLLHVYMNEAGAGFKEVQREVIRSTTDLVAFDMDQDGSDEVVLAGEWQELRVYEVSGGRLEYAESLSERLSGTGLWSELRASDIDGDGDEDLVALGHGRNGICQKGARLYVADIDGNGTYEQFVARQENGIYYPILDFDDLTSRVPSVRKVYPTYDAYSKASMDDLLQGLPSSAWFSTEITEPNSGIFINQEGEYTFRPMPPELQWSSHHALCIDDVNQDGVLDLLIGGNHDLYKPQYGRDDASYGWLIQGNLTGGEYQFGDLSSLGISGEIRSIEKVDTNQYLITTTTDQLFSIQSQLMD
ncbi:MAG: VCBS repeat-containing protein [Bacteroidota bacterium]